MREKWKPRNSDRLTKKSRSIPPQAAVKRPLRTVPLFLNTFSFGSDIAKPGEF